MPNQGICLLLVIFVLILALLFVNLSCAKNRECALEKTGGGPLQDLKNLVGTFDVPKSKQNKIDGPCLAEKLTNAGWKLYIKQSCPWCHLQMDMFGSDSMYLNIVDCSSDDLRPEDLKDCGQTWVYPTWINGDYILPGSQSFVDLNNALKSFKGTVSRKEYKQMKKTNL